jgi:hypothetical protein
MIMIPDSRGPLVSLYDNIFRIPDDLVEKISREADGDWSLIQYFTGADASETNALSECGPLALLRTEMNDAFVDYMRGVIGPIEQDANESLDDYLTVQGIKGGQTNNYDLIRITKLSEATRSVVLGNRLQEGLVAEICCLSDRGAVHFPSIDETVEMSCGQVVYAPGGFPYEHQLCSDNQTTYLKRLIR